MIRSTRKGISVVHDRVGGTIELQPHPEDVIDVPADIFAKMSARLKGESLADSYGDDDRVSKELLIQQERKKLGRIFGSEAEVQDAFSSLKAIKDVRAELAFEKVDRELLAAYTYKLSSREAVDEVDGYRTILFSAPIQTKQQRLRERTRVIAKARVEVQETFGLLAQSYLETHFDVLSISKEMIQLHEPLRNLMNGGKLMAVMDELLGRFYGDAA